jgi:hypothetical protein
VINNPARRPPTEYFVANASQPHICTDPATFPENCTLIVREGDPSDYLSTRGPCSILGIIRKSRQPNIISNGCVLRANQKVNSLSIEIIDDSLNTFKITGNTEMWIKLDLQCSFISIN